MIHTVQLMADQSELDADCLSNGDEDLDFCSSKLGTKEYWDEVFDRDLNTYRETGDVGEVWFGQASVRRLIEWLESNSQVSRSHSILDIGCGNGMTLVSLAKRGYNQLFGIDYSASAIELARTFASDKSVSITYEVCNIVEPDSRSEGCCLSHQYDICIDKGTYDAISLNPDNASEQRSKYIQNVYQLVKPQGLLIITSCNWTESELTEHFNAGSGFEVADKIPTPTFSFGGSTGNKETVVVFRRRLT